MILLLYNELVAKNSKKPIKIPVSKNGSHHNDVIHFILTYNEFGIPNLSF